jgi:ribosomal-protein-alanine N-acetyltransferase
MKIIINGDVFLSAYEVADRGALVQHLGDEEIYRNTLRIPHPYTSADADTWLGIAAAATKEHGEPIHLAIRDGAGRLIGGCGFDGLVRGHRAEIGYWLARPFWNRGIMTLVVPRACEDAFNRFALVRIAAHVFANNAASARVLEKAGFQEEGYLRKHYLKDAVFLDARVYALVR